MIPAVDFDSSLQSSLDQFSEETFDMLEEGSNPEIVTETLSFEDLSSFNFSSRAKEVEKSIRRFMPVFSQKHQQSFRGFQYRTEN